MLSERLSQQLQESVDSKQREQPLREYDTGPEGFQRFCRDVLGINLWSRQIEIAQSVICNRRTAVRSGHSVGKTMVVAAICEWWFSCRGLCFYTTAPGRDAVKDLLWKQIKTNRENANRPLPGVLLDSGEIKVQGCSSWWAKGFATNKAERAQGKHSPGMLVVGDEAAGIADFIWDALESSLASEDVRMLIIGNPNYDKGYFYHAFHEQKEMWNTIHISSLESPNITGKGEKVPGLATAKWVEEQKLRYRDEPEKFRMRVLGEWPNSDSEDKAIPMEFIEAAQKLWLELEEEEIYLAEEPNIHCAFVDVAGWGKDKSTMAYLRGQRIHIEFEVDDRSEEGLMVLAEQINRWICSLPDHQKPKWIAVDSDAVGAGVHSRLVQLRKENKPHWGRCRLVRFSWGMSAKDKKRYVRQIDELHWELRKALDPTKERHERIAIPPGNRVAGQLNLRKWSEDRLERKKVETKEELARRGKRSPDIADACVGTMFRPRLVKAS